MKKHFYIQEHTLECQDRRKKEPTGNTWIDSFMSMPCCTQKFVFFANGYFFLIEYNTCLHVDWNTKEKWIQQIVNGITKTEDFYYVERAYELSKRFEKERSSMIQKQKFIRQIHSIYKGGKTYCITSKIPFIDLLSWNEKVSKNLKKFTKYLIENEFTYHVETAEKLAFQNTLYVKPITINKTINEMIININKQVKQ